MREWARHGFGSNKRPLVGKSGVDWPGTMRGGTEEASTGFKMARDMIVVVVLDNLLL